MDILPGIRSQLLDAQGEPFILRIDIQNNGLNLLSLPIEFARIFDLFRPGHLRDMNQTVNSFFKPDKDAEIGDRLHPAFDPAPDGIFLFDQDPRIRRGLLHSQGDPAFFKIKVKDHHLHRVADLNDLGGVFHLFCPSSFQ